jgi:hypothetical protein
VLKDLHRAKAADIRFQWPLTVRHGSRPLRADPGLQEAFLPNAILSRDRQDGLIHKSIYVPSQQPQGQLQTQHSVGT